jgi:cell division protein FtsW
MTTFARDDRSVLGRWWWTVDRWTLAALTLLVGVGAVLTLAASPAVAERIELDSFYFVRHQLAFLPFALALMLGVSLLSPLGVRRLAVAGFGLALCLLLLTLFIGDEIKGASRWISFAGLSLQPSEFVKPTFAVVTAWLLTEERIEHRFSSRLVCAGCLVLVAGLVALQPDFGTTMAVTVVWLLQLFLAGLPVVWLLLLIGLAVGLVAAGYVLLPHVSNRIDRFLDPTSGDSYQIDRSLDAFMHGGLLGRGPGQGSVKEILPDAHTDFIFAVAGEEFGAFLCLFIVALFAFIVLRGYVRVLQEKSLFVLLAVAGLLAQFGLQALINMAVTLRLMPAKGMTLPFISYGGSSLLAIALGMGMVLALTRHRRGVEGLV